MTIEDEIARTLRDADPEPYFAGGWTAEQYYTELAKSLAPLLNRVRAEAWDEGSDHGYNYRLGEEYGSLDEEDRRGNPYREQNSEGNET